MLNFRYLVFEKEKNIFLFFAKKCIVPQQYKLFINREKSATLFPEMNSQIFYFSSNEVWEFEVNT